MRVLARIGVGAAVLVALTLLAAIAVAGSRVPLWKQLRSEVARDAHRTWPRPAFGEEVDGVFSTLAAPAHVELKWHPDGLNCVDLWKKGVGPVSDECRGWVVNHWPATTIVLTATHAKLGSSDIRTFQDQGDATEGFIVAAQVASVHMLVDLEHHENASAAGTCLETLALGRDASVIGTVLGTMVATGVVRTAFPTCAAVLDATPDKLKYAHGIQAIEDGLPPLSQMFHTEALAEAATLDLERRSGWSPSAFLEAYELLEGMVAYEADARIADEPEPARSADIGRNEGLISRSLDHTYGTTLDFVQRSDGLRPRLELLRALAEVEEMRDRTGAWPAAPATLTLVTESPDSALATLRDPRPQFGPLEVAMHANSGSPHPSGK